MATVELDVVKDIPGYKVILKAVLKSQIQQLVEQLAAHTDEESVILTASVSDGTLSHLGSDSGKSFLGDHEDIKSQFLGFCLRRHHKQKEKERQEKERQEKERQEREARQNLPVTPSRQMGPRFSPRSPRFPSPRQQGVFPVTLSRAGGPMRSPGARHEPYPRPMKRPLNFDQQGRGPSQSPRMPLSGQVIKIEADDPDDPEASNNSNIQSGDSGPGSPSQANADTNQSAPSLKTETSDREEDAKSSSSASTIPNEAADLKLSLDSDLSSLLPTVEGGDNEQSGAPSTPQTTGSGLDPNVNVKVEALTEAEMELEITGVELGPQSVQPGTSQENWGPNVPGGAMGYSPQGATGNQSDMQQQGYDMDKTPKHALILFDVDGCTSIVATSKLTSSHVLQPSIKCSFVHGRTEYEVEILQLSDSKKELNAFEKEWARSERAMALDREKSERGDSENGYLMVWPEEEVVPPSPTATRRPEQTNLRREPLVRGEAVVPVTEEIVGSNNRTITVHYQGSSEESQHTATLWRNPLFLDDLSQDMRDCVLARVEDYEHMRRSIATQTEDILVFRDKEEILASCDPIGRSLSDLFSKLQGQGNTITEIFHFLQNQKTTEILQEILSVVKGLRDGRDVSKLLQIGILNDLNTSAVTENTDIATNNENDFLATSIKNEYLATSNENDHLASENKNDHLASKNANDHLATNSDNDHLATSNENDHLTSETTNMEEAALLLPNSVTSGTMSGLHVNTTDDSKSNKEKHQLMEHRKKLMMRTSPSPATSTLSQSLMCNKGPIVEIDSYQDMETVASTAEVRIAPYLQKQFHVCTNWPGGFAWQLAQRIYRTDELVGRNYYGKFQKPCLSPRRRHAIEHAIIDNIGDDMFSLRKAVEGINTGIRNKTNKGKMKAARLPVAPHPRLSQDAFGNSVN